MYIVVAGAGLIGSEVTKRLISLKHDVVVMDINKEVCERLYSNYGAMTINGDATNLNDLKQSGIEKADMLVTCLRSDADNIATILLAKSLGLEKVVACVRQNQYIDAYNLVGNYQTVQMTDIVIDNIVLAAVDSKIKKLYSFGYGKVEMYMIRIPKDSVVVGKTIKEVIKLKKFPHNSMFNGFYREKEDKFIIPNGYSVFQENDAVFVTAEKQNIEKIIDLIMK